MENLIIFGGGFALFTCIILIVQAFSLDKLKNKVDSLHDRIADSEAKLYKKVRIESLWIGFLVGEVSLEQVFEYHKLIGVWNGSQDQFRVAYSHYIDHKNKFVTKEDFNQLEAAKREFSKTITHTLLHLQHVLGFIPEEMFLELVSDEKVIKNSIERKQILDSRFEPIERLEKSVADIYRNKIVSLRKRIEQDRIGTQFMLGLIDEESVSSQLKKYDIPENGMLVFLMKEKQKLDSRFVPFQEYVKFTKTFNNNQKNIKIQFMEVQKDLLTLDRKSEHAFMKLGIKLDISKKEDKQLSKKADKSLAKLEKKSSNGKN